MPLLTPIPVGFVLDNRYEVAQFLGYGGFGRTYLARDRQRFNELCVLKEFAPQISAPEVLRKAAELFQREAGTLYQLRHEQIPEFRAILQATIDHQDVLLIIEQYISGETYEQWVDAGNRLDEVGAVQFLQDLLPVLSYVHDRGVVHRDISPDNLIRETRTHKPYLIDFGSVKQVASTAMQLSGVASGTQIHKPGFSPPEQLRGEVTPSTDLYSLAVTTLVLMTGRSPLELYDSQMASWRWRDLLSLSPGFGNFLDRLLAYRPTDRPQSALVASQLLHSIVGISGLAPGDLAPYIPPTPILPSPAAPILDASGPSSRGGAPNAAMSRSPNPQNAPVSQMRTIAIAPADPGTIFPTTYPTPNLARQSDRRSDQQSPRHNPRYSPQKNSQHSQISPTYPDARRRNQGRESDRLDPAFQDSGFHGSHRDQPEEDILWKVISFPWKLIGWGFKGLWMGILALDWVLTWVWRAILILGLLAGGAAASFFWSLRESPNPIAQQRSSQQRSPQPNAPNNSPLSGFQLPSIEWPTLPEVKLPEVKLPEVQLPTLPNLKLPEVKLPDWAAGQSSSCAETIARSEAFGFTKAQFNQQVNTRFHHQHPELKDRLLTDRPEDAGLRQDWCAIADQILTETPKPR